MDNNCLQSMALQRENSAAINLQNVFKKEAKEKSTSSDSPPIQIESVPIDYIFLGSSKSLAPNTSKNSPIVPPSSDTVTPNPKRKCLESVFSSEEEKRSRDTPRPNFQRVNEVFEEIIANLRHLFPLCRGLHRSLCTGDDRLLSNRPELNDYGGKYVKITAISPNILCLAGTEYNIPMMDLLQTQWTMENAKSYRKAYFGTEADVLPYYQRIVNAFWTKRNSLCLAENEQPICLRKRRISFSKPYAIHLIKSITYQSWRDVGAVTLFEFILKDSNCYTLRIFFANNSTWIRIINCDKNEMNRPLLQLNDSEIFDKRIRASQSDLYVCRELGNLLKGFEWGLKGCLENPVANDYMTWITEKYNINASSSCSELFPRLSPPTNSAPYGVVCQLWKDLTRCSFANLDASLDVTHADFPLQVLEVPCGKSITVSKIFLIVQNSKKYLLFTKSEQVSVPFPFKLSFRNYLYLCIDFLHRPVESRRFWFLVRGVEQHPLSACLRVADRIDDQGLVSFTMDWMQAIGSDVMINDDQLTTVLQHLLVSVEKGIERLEWNVIPKPWINTINSGEGSSTFPRCCHVRSHPVDMKDSSVQTTLEDESEQEGDSSIVIKDSELTNSEVNGVFLGKFACIQQDNQSVSVVRKNYVPSCESIATQTSTNLPPSKSTEKASNDLLFALPPIAVREEDPDDGYCEHVLTQPATISQVDPDLLHSEVALLPGCRDIKNRSIVVIRSDGIKDGFQLSSCHLAQLLLYFHTIPKKEVIGKGFLVLIDASKHTDDFWSALDETFCLIEANLSNVISEVLILFEENNKINDISTLFPTSRIQFEILFSSEKLLTFVQKDQLLCEYGGEYIYDHHEWISFRKFLEPFINGCRLSGRHLVNLLEELRGSRLPVSSTLTHQMIEQQKRNVTHTFHDEQLRHLEEEGDTILKELHSYRTKSPFNHDYRENLERTSILYEELRKAMTKLARLADKRLNRLEECLQLKTFQEESSQVLSWLCRKGNESLERHQAIADSLGAIKQQEEEFEKFYFLAMRQIEKGNDLLEEVSTFNHDSSLPKIQEENPSEPVEEESGVQELATSLRQHLGSFTERLEGTRERIEDTGKCYQLMDKSYEWALDAMRFVSNMGITNTESAEGILHQIRCLQDYADNHLCVPEETFVEMLDLASKLGNEKLLEQCKIVKLRCEETVELIKARQATLQKVKQQMEVDSLRGPCWEAEDASQTPRTMRSHSQPMNAWLPMGASTPYPGFSCHQRRRSTGGPMGVSMSQRYGSPIGSYTAFPSSYYPSAKESYHLDNFSQEKDERLLNQGLITEDLTANGPVASISKTLLDIRGAHKTGHSSSSSSASSTSSKDTSITRRIPRSLVLGTDTKSTKKLLRRCHMWQMRDDALEKVKAEVREQTALLRVEKLRDCQRENRSEIPETPNTDRIPRKSLLQSCPDSNRGPVPVNTHLMSPIDSPDANCKKEMNNDLEAKSKKTLMLIMKELIQTERDYVKSLEYIIENYIPELLRDDIPQALRGQRNVVFGNIEKIYEFHFQYFLTELEHCESSPFTVGQCFLDFQPQFYLYALYNKNKPKSDALMSEYGNAFFRKKQLELQDKMDLASYLLKPVQRMGKYALLLKQLLKECPEREKEHKALKAAEEMVRFQLRHGNDLLAMDALRDCDVNVKEQGLLLRQDEFIVWQGRSRKCMRHVFLFEDLILFSKARRDPQRKGYEMYQYKHSIKTTDLGMTEQVGDSPTKFEIWFRKRKLNDTFLLQAPNPEVKAAWTREIRSILLDQAVNNKKNRLAEMSSMGIGNKPCLDIKPSEDQINDRSISIHQLARAPRFRNSIAVSPYDIRNNRNSIISVSSSSSSGSSQSSFSFYGALNLGFEPGDSPRPLHRSHTQQSQCSTESGFCTDVSMAGDSPENEQPRHKRAERSDSLLSSDSMSTNVSPTEVPPCMTKFDQSLEESLTTSM